MATNLPANENLGNGAPEKIEEYFRDKFGMKPVEGIKPLVEHMLMWLWNEGFKVVPVEEEGGDIAA